DSRDVVLFESVDPQLAHRVRPVRRYGRLVFPARAGTWRGFGLRRLFRHDGCAHASFAFGTGRLANRFHRKTFGPGIVRDEISANIVPAVAAQPGRGEELDALELVIVFDPECFSVDVFAVTIPLVAECCRDRKSTRLNSSHGS